MKYQQTQTLTGGWVDKSQLKNGQRAKIVSEAQPVPSSFTDPKGNPTTQDVARVQFEGQKESVNCNLNKPTVQALIQAFGEDSKDWMGHYLTVEVEKVRVAGKAVTALYLIPEGFHKTDDEAGYAVVVRKEHPVASVSSVNQDAEIPVFEDNLNGEQDLPF